MSQKRAREPVSTAMHSTACTMPSIGSIDVTSMAVITP